MPDLAIYKSHIESGDSGVNTVLSTTLSAVMYFPGAEQEELRKQAYYEARCLLESVPYLVAMHEGNENYVDSVLLTLVKNKFTTWDNFTNIIFQDDKFDISNDFLDLTFKKGCICGVMFDLIFHERMGVKDAAKAVIPDILKGDILDGSSATVTNIENNIWKKFRTVAHWWAALTQFHIKSRSKTYIAFDRLVSNGVSPCVKDGVTGFIEAVQHYYNYSVENNLTYNKSYKKIINPNDAWNIVTI